MDTLTIYNVYPYIAWQKTNSAQTMAKIPTPIGKLSLSASNNMPKWRISKKLTIQQIHCPTKTKVALIKTSVPLVIQLFNYFISTL